MKIIVFILSAVTVINVCFSKGSQRGCKDGPLKGSNQVIISITDSWNSPTSKTVMFERHGNNNGWSPKSKIMDAVVGRNGLGWGSGLHGSVPSRAKKRKSKKEGDGRAPAGVFRLPESFGYKDKNRVKTGLPYRKVDGSSRCVDDKNSAFYNDVIYAPRSGMRDWASNVEKLKRRDHLYELAVVVDHNRVGYGEVPSYSTVGAGSCIFLHVWRKKGKGTAGCTAFSRDNMKGLLRSLQASKSPTFVQLPQAEYNRLKKQWCLPDISRTIRPKKTTKLGEHRGLPESCKSRGMAMGMPIGGMPGCSVNFSPRGTDPKRLIQKGQGSEHTPIKNL